MGRVPDPAEAIGEVQRLLDPSFSQGGRPTDGVISSREGVSLSMSYEVDKNRFSRVADKSNVDRQHCLMVIFV
jgi:hypothetical protein